MKKLRMIVSLTGVKKQALPHGSVRALPILDRTLMKSANILNDLSADGATLNHCYRWTVRLGQIHSGTDARARAGTALHRHRLDVSRRGAGSDRIKHEGNRRRFRGRPGRKDWHRSGG